ncbi:MAG: hypothetical protein CME70_21690 [Halobacteriovorax sp.]|nr:hypothetical protein [Halobacteriovorax sp.]|tara:strand:- start:9202 stop:9702 length:501 start_codon:yes stop_codon:yes gene_type:complete
MRGLLAVERMVLESIDKDRTTVKRIAADTALSEMFVRTILSNLKDYGLISYSKGFYSLNLEKENLRVYNQNKLVKHEINELFESFVDNHFSEENKPELTLKMQKIWLTDLEFKILRSMMINMDSFIKSIRKDRLLRPEEEILSEQRVVFWGIDSYSNLINSNLSVA